MLLKCVKSSSGAATRIAIHQKQRQVCLHQSGSNVSVIPPFQNRKLCKQIALTNYLTDNSLGRTSVSIESRQKSERAKASVLIMCERDEVKDGMSYAKLVCESACLLNTCRWMRLHPDLGNQFRTSKLSRTGCIERASEV